jgi:putative MATE family efflux protein
MQKGKLQVNISNKQILTITLPIAAAILVPQLNFITNNIFLGYLDTEHAVALGVAGITGVYYLIFAALGNGLNAGIQSLIAKHAGENKPQQIGHVFFNGVIVAIILAVLGILITWLLAPVILNYSLHNKQHVSMAVSFLQIRILGLPFLYLYQLRNALLVGTNNSKLLIFGTSAEALVNVVLDYGLIFGNWGLPKLGFNGAAVASVIAECSGLLVIAYIVQIKKIHVQFILFKQKIISKQIIKNILNIASPLMGQFAISIISWEFFYILIEHKGSLQLAISNAMRNIFGFFGCFVWAFASTTNAMVSNVLGQKQPKRVLLLIKKILILNISFTLLVGLLLNIFPHAFLSIYGQGEVFITNAIPVLRVVSIGMLLSSIAVVWLNAVVATGNTKLNLLTEILAITAYCIYVYWVLEKWQMSIVWGWMSEWLYWILLMLPPYFYMLSGKWKTKFT